MVQKFRTKIVEIEAMRWTGDNLAEMKEWTEGQFDRLIGKRTHTNIDAQVYDFLHDTWIGVAPGQWIVRGAKGEFYPCDDETFHWKYEEVNRWMLEKEQV